MAIHCPRTTALRFAFGSAATWATKTPNICLRSSSRTVRTFTVKVMARGMAAYELNATSASARPVRRRAPQAAMPPHPEPHDLCRRPTAVWMAWERADTEDCRYLGMAQSAGMTAFDG